MTNYNVGDLASLVSSTDKKTGSKLQSLFDEHWNRKQKPDMLQNAKKIKTHLKEPARKCDFESNSFKRMKKKKLSSSPSSSSLTKVQTDFNSDFLPLQNKKGPFEARNSNLRRKQKRQNCFSENLMEETEKQNVGHGFIRCSKNKRLKTAKEDSVSAINIEPDHVKDNLFSEIDARNISNSEPKKQKIKKKSKTVSSQSYPNSHFSVTNEQVDAVIATEPDIVKGNLFREKTLNAQAKKQKTKKKSKSSNQNISSLPEEEDNSDADESGVAASKIRQQNLNDSPFTLFVGNLPISMKRKMLNKLFSSFGPIKSARLRGAVSTKMSIPKKVAEIKSEYHEGLQSRTGFVVFKDEESAKSALSLNGTLIDGHHIVVDFASQVGEKKHYNNDLSIFLGNLPFDIDDETVRSAFEECGEIQAVRIIRDKSTGVGKGFGFVQFQKAKSKEKALSLEDLEIKGRTIRVKPIESDQGKNSGSKKTVMMIRNNMAMKRTKELGSKKSVKKLLKKGRKVHKKKQIARLLGEKFVK